MLVEQDEDLHHLPIDRNDLVVQPGTDRLLACFGLGTQRFQVRSGQIFVCAGPLTAGDVRQEHTSARLHLARAGLSHLGHVTETETAPEFVIEQLHNSWQDRIERIKEHDNGEPSATASIYRRLRRDLLAVESAELDRFYRTNAITDATRRRIQRLLDLEHAGLGEDEP
jgi:hypothetical protein